METKELLERWQVLLKEPLDATALRGVLQERTDILHRLNQLGKRDIDGLSIFTIMEITNVSIREVNRAAAA